MRYNRFDQQRSQYGMDRLVTVQPLAHDFWRVTMGPERSLEVYTEERALRLADEWAQVHAPCEVKICDSTGNAVRLAFFHAVPHPVKGFPEEAPEVAQ
jgi:hypothetical protein